MNHLWVAKHYDKGGGWIVETGNGMVAHTTKAKAQLIAAAPDMYLAGQTLDYAIGSAIIEITKVITLNPKLLEIVNIYILPAQENWRKALIKAEGKEGGIR